ncbi:hypothetical protein EJ04DRAFT_545972 [Polyplosphaeria fusca]|uniref:Translocation protein n=1 Tax=Polyplosphaeria fusca TaxID=682080 RepID=A0A9P4QMF8_9PLEO|nr:hypothetical protein EJ04DRAFT_545972 [Polyplosphaeria fusca]
MWPFDLVNWVGLTVPLAYLFILVSSLAAFSSFYRKRQAAKATSLQPWFPPNLQRDIYLSLLHMENPKVPDGVLKAALMRRATEDLNRMMQVQQAKQPLQGLLQRNSVGNDLFQRLQHAEHETQTDIRDVMQEANAFTPGWGNFIFQSANEMAHNKQTREKLAEFNNTRASEKEWWDQRKATIQSDFMKELDDEKSEAASAPAAKPAAKIGSDDDAVIVESGGPAEKAGKSKKKKGKN